MTKTPFSKIIAGTMTWGIWSKNLDKNQMIDLMNSCQKLELRHLIMPIFMEGIPMKPLLEPLLAKAELTEKKSN